jgi:hypothetical protein
MRSSLRTPLRARRPRTFVTTTTLRACAPTPRARPPSPPRPERRALGGTDRAVRHSRATWRPPARPRRATIASMPRSRTDTSHPRLRGDPGAGMGIHFVHGPASATRASTRPSPRCWSTRRGATARCASCRRVHGLQAAVGRRPSRNAAHALRPDVEDGPHAELRAARLGVAAQRDGMFAPFNPAVSCPTGARRAPTRRRLNTRMPPLWCDTAAGPRRRRPVA